MQPSHSAQPAIRSPSRMATTVVPQAVRKMTKTRAEAPDAMEVTSKLIQSAATLTSTLSARTHHARLLPNTPPTIHMPTRVANTVVATTLMKASMEENADTGPNVPIHHA